MSRRRRNMNANPPISRIDRQILLAALFVVLFAALSLMKCESIAAPAVSTGPTLRSTVEFNVSDADRAHWAFVPIKRSAPPLVASQQLVANPIDRFILARLSLIHI